MKVSIATWLLIGSAVTILLGVSLGVSFFNTIQRQLEEARWVKEKQATIDQVSMLEKLLVDMETAQRAYRNTNDKKFLFPFPQAQTDIVGIQQILNQQLKDNPRKLALLDQVKKQEEALYQLWSNPVMNGDFSDRRSLAEITNLEKEKMDEVRMLVKKMHDTEHEELVKRENDLVAYVEKITQRTVIGTSLLFIIAGILTYFYFLEFKSRRKTETLLHKNVIELEELNRSSREKNWYLTGLTNINDALQNVQEIESLGQSVLKAIVGYLELPAAGFYAYEEEENKLVLKASIALSSQTNQAYNVGEGLVGQAATDKHVAITKSVPASYWSIASGSGAGNAGQIACVPLWYGQELKGVIELASFIPFSEQQTELLKRVAKDISIAVNGIYSRHKIVGLLKQLQWQTAALENQQDELRQTNEDLTRQTESLQASEEELRVQEEELRHINSELEEKNEAIEVARRALSQKAKELEVTGQYKSEFLANMSHELRTPLNSVLILANILAENKAKNLTDKQIEYANVIHKSGSDLLKLINDILDLSKIEAGKIDFQFESVPLKSIVRDIEQLFRVVAEEKKVKFVTQIQASVPETFYTDKQRLEQVIQNLLSNAFKFTPKNGSVTLSFSNVDAQADFSTEALRKSQQILLIRVADTGVGIPIDKQQLIFEAFQQADGATNRKYGGTGLGLSIIKELVKRLEGEVRLESEVGKGSTFSIFIPQHHATNKPESSQAAPTLTVVEPDFSKDIVEQLKIEDDRNGIEKGDLVMLIIEDDPTFAGIVRDLARSKNYKTVVALKGDEGMMYARKYKPSAIILDVHLPVIDGVSILSWLKNEDKLKHIPVHVISGSDESRLLLEGAQAFIQKPVKTQDLEKVFNLLEAQLNVEIKKVLILVNEAIQRNNISQVLGKRYPDLKWEIVTSEKEAADKISLDSYDCLIMDIRKNLREGMEKLGRLKESEEAESIPVIVYIDEDLTPVQERQLRRLSSVIIRESMQSMERLMDEMELFLYKVQEVEVKKLPQPSAAFSQRGLEGKKVLLVDDDMRNVFALSTLLEDQKMTVITADNGKEALEMLRQNPDTDIVLMDIMMPEMDGYEATARIRNDLRMNKLPVIALTAKAMPGDREKVIEAGASDYITKPVDTGQLFSLMRVWLSK